jgi:hypothetical protein
MLPAGIAITAATNIGKLRTPRRKFIIGLDQRETSNILGRKFRARNSPGVRLSHPRAMARMNAGRAFNRLK